MTEEIEKLEKRVKELEEQPTCNCLNEVDAVWDYFWALMEYLKLDVDCEEHSGISATTDEPDTVISVKVIPAKKIK